MIIDEIEGFDFDLLFEFVFECWVCFEDVMKYVCDQVRCECVFKFGIDVCLLYD